SIVPRAPALSRPGERGECVISGGSHRRGRGQMKPSIRIRSAVVAAVVLGLAGGGAFANCLDFGGFAIFQCADAAFFNPPPVPVACDPNNRPTNVSVLFWQLGFGNAEAGHCDLGTSKCTAGLLNKACTSASLPTPDAFCNGNTGIGTSGTGLQNVTDFNGND